MMMENGFLEMNERGFSIIRSCEGLRLKAYRCPSGIPTIGWGHTRGVCDGMTCSPEEAEKWLREDVAAAESFIKLKVEQPLSENQFSALVSFVFNIGVSNFAQSTLLLILNQGDYSGVPAQMMRWKYGSDWTGKKVLLPGLVNRRMLESDLWSASE